MKKYICLLILLIVLTSCSSSTDISSSTEISAAPISKESILISAEPIISGTNTNSELKTAIISFGETNAVLPILPTDSLNNALESSLVRFLDDIDAPFKPKLIDFYYGNAFDTASFTFFVSDSVEIFDKSKFYFAYNTETLEESKLEDFFADKQYSNFLQRIGGDISKVDGFNLDENGINVFVNDKKFQFSPMEFNDGNLFYVFHPDSYEPVKNNNEKYVALTFDDGPNYLTTPKLLDTLAEKNVKATFFMVGYNIEAYKSTVKEVYEAGHDIGLHSYGHTNYLQLPGDDIISDLDKCSNLIYSIIGKRPYLVRPPFGNMDMTKVNTDDYFFVNWNVDPLDWKYDNAKEIAEEAIKNVTSGSIILLHDIYNVSCEAAGLIIDELVKQGYRFVTISEYFDLDKNKADNKLHFYRSDYNVNKN